MDSGLSGYRTALDALFARTGATSKFGLERTVALLERLGNPHRRIRTLHVAGTNGKGSVVVTLYALLRAKGLRVGRYTSPHLMDFRERIVIDDQIAEEEVLEFLSRWEASALELDATFFEITTALALDHFARNEVDIAVIETGLGGRLDATNVVTPLVGGITSISIDHTEFLGDSIESIAREKAGIFKPRVPAVIGPMPTEARQAIRRTAADAGVDAVIDATRLYDVSEILVSNGGTEFTVEHGRERVRLKTGLVGRAQADNASVALAMLDAAGPPWSVSLNEAQNVLPGVTLAGRFQWFEKFILDVAHNPDGMQALAVTLDSVRPPRPMIAVLGVLLDKNWRDMMAALAPVVDEIVVVMPPSAPAARAWDPAEPLAFARSRGWNARFDPDFASALSSAADRAQTVVVTGSFHTVGDALLELGIRI